MNRLRAWLVCGLTGHGIPVHCSDRDVHWWECPRCRRILAGPTIERTRA